MDAGSWRWLGAGRIGFVPAVVEEDKDRDDVMFFCDLQILVHAIFESCGILLPGQVVEEDAHAVQSDGCGVAQFTIDGTRIEAGSLPHFELVDRRAGDEVAAPEPSFGSVPFGGFCFAPDGTLRRDGMNVEDR